MDRLTRRLNNGRLVLTKDFPTTQDVITVLMDRIELYENIGTLEEITEFKEMFKAYRHVCGGMTPEEIESMKAELSEYRKAKEDGRLVEVVRCRDCRFFEKTQSYLCNMHNRSALGENYCSYGVKKAVLKRQEGEE